MAKLRGLDLSSKIIIIIIITAISFTLLFFFIPEILLVDNTSRMPMMGHMMGSNPDYTIAILLSLMLALVIGLLITIWLKPEKNLLPTKNINELDLIKRALSNDEKKSLR